MLTTIQWFYLVAIFSIAIAGGIVPLLRPGQARTPEGFPRGEAFSAGVFLALSLTMLLPSSFHIFRQRLPNLDYPIASVIAIVAFLCLLAMEHWLNYVVTKEGPADENVPLPALVPIIVTTMIAIPSFFLGTTLGMSDAGDATLIFLAIILHKGTAAFALALAMVRSTLKTWQTLLLFLLFACATPLGVLAGGEVQEYFTGSTALVKAVVLSLGAGTFLYMGTLHEMKRASLIEHCWRPTCFCALLVGLTVTAFVRLMMGEAHSL